MLDRTAAKGVSGACQHDGPANTAASRDMTRSLIQLNSDPTLEHMACTARASDPSQTFAGRGER